MAEHIRRQPTLKNTILVALTSYVREVDRRQAKESGYDLHLDNLIIIDELLMALAKAIAALSNH